MNLTRRTFFRTAGMGALAARILGTNDADTAAAQGQAPATLCAILAATTIVMAMVPRPAYAQLKGHYVPGFTGLQSGSQGPPAITIVLPLFFYTTDTLKDDQGNTLGQHPRINSSFLGPGVLWVTSVKLFGGNLGGQIIPVDFMKARIEGPSLDVPGAFRFSDIYVQPLQIGWERPRADFVAGWGVFMPTGKWTLGGDDNGGLGMWSNDFQVGTTLRLDNQRACTASVLGTYELHSKKKDVDLKAGDILTFEGGLKRIVNSRWTG